MSGARAGNHKRALAGLLALALLPASAACEPPPSEQRTNQPPPRAGEFDGERAFDDLRSLVALGPRPSGSEGAAATRRLIGERLRQAGFRVEQHELQTRRPDGEMAHFSNVVGIRRGRLPGILLFVTHYDTKHLHGLRFVGANDGASGVALLLELARQVAASGHEHTLWLAFCDGEEAFGRDITRADGLYGSRGLAQRMQAEGNLERVRALVLVDMVADLDLNLAGNRQDSEHLRQLLAEEAAALGHSAALDRRSLPGLIDDHTPFAELGVEEVLTLIDFQFGARSTPGPWWHTERDDLAAVSARSLNTVGELTVGVLRRIDGEPGVSGATSGR